MTGLTVKILVSGLVAVVGQPGSDEITLVLPQVETAGMSVGAHAVPNHEALFGYRPSDVDGGLLDCSQEELAWAAEDLCFMRLDRQDVEIQASRRQGAPFPVWSQPDYVLSFADLPGGKNFSDLPGGEGWIAAEIFDEEPLGDRVRARAKLHFDSATPCGLLREHAELAQKATAHRFTLQNHEDSHEQFLANGTVFELETASKQVTVKLLGPEAGEVRTLVLDGGDDSEVRIALLNVPIDIDHVLKAWLGLSTPGSRAQALDHHFRVYWDMLPRDHGLHLEGVEKVEKETDFPLTCRAFFEPEEEPVLGPSAQAYFGARLSPQALPWLAPAAVDAFDERRSVAQSSLDGGQQAAVLSWKWMRDGLEKLADRALRGPLKTQNVVLVTLAPSRLGEALTGALREFCQLECSDDRKCELLCLEGKGHSEVARLVYRSREELIDHPDKARAILERLVAAGPPICPVARYLPPAEAGGVLSR